MVDEPETTIDELWRMSPDLITDAQFERLIVKQRENRRLWSSGAAAPKKEAKEKKVKAPAGPKGPPPSLSDLGL